MWDIYAYSGTRVKHIPHVSQILTGLPRHAYALDMTAQPVGIGYAPEWTLGDRLRKARKQTGMTQRAFAELIGEEPSRYAQWEADNNRPRHLVDVAQNIEGHTGVSAAWLLGLVTTSGGTRSALDRDVNQSTGFEKNVLGGAHRFRRGAAAA